MSAIKLMIINEQALVGQNLSAMISSEQDLIIVGAIQNSNEVIEKVIDLKPDVVLMDIPSKNGTDITAELKEKIPMVKILAMTNTTDQHHLSKIIKAGALGYILKDIDQQTLIEAIRTVARGDAYIQPCLLSNLLSEFRQFLSEENRIMLPKEFGLTQRELEIVSYIACGESNKEIAERLFISEKTVKNHVSNILRKMALEDRTQVAVYAYRKGLIAK